MITSWRMNVVGDLLFRWWQVPWFPINILRKLWNNYFLVISLSLYLEGFVFLGSYTRFNSRMSHVATIMKQTSCTKQPSTRFELILLGHISTFNSFCENYVIPETMMVLLFVVLISCSQYIRCITFVYYVYLGYEDYICVAICLFCFYYVDPVESYTTSLFALGWGGGTF